MLKHRKVFIGVRSRLFDDTHSLKNADNIFVVPSWCLITSCLSALIGEKDTFMEEKANEKCCWGGCNHISP